MVFAGFAHRHFVIRLDLERRNIDLAPIDLNMAVTHDLPRLRAAGAKTHAVNDAVQTALETTQQVLAGDAFLVRGFFKADAELRFQHAVDAAGFLLLAQLQSVAYQLGFAVFAMLPRNEVALFNGALLAVAAFTLQKQFHAFTPA